MTLINNWQKSSITISTHTLTWSVTLIQGLQVFTIQISTHTLTWSVTILFLLLMIRMVFQLTRSRGAWLKELLNLPLAPYFNSHAHVERDEMPDAVENDSWISTHTLTWSVTGTNMKAKIRKKISTHTLTWSVTCSLHSRSKPDKFQLTRSRGAWQMGFDLHRHDEAFQLTRSRGAWRVAGYLGQCIINFNSHAHVERDRL